MRKRNGYEKWLLGLADWHREEWWYQGCAHLNCLAGDDVLKGLEQYNHRSFKQPKKIIEKLIFGNPLELQAMNHFAHSVWAYSLFKGLVNVLDFDRAQMRLGEPVFLVTMIDFAQLRGVPKTRLSPWTDPDWHGEWDPDFRGDWLELEEPLSGASPNNIIQRQSLWIPPKVNSIGVVEPELFVSTQKVSTYLRFCVYHSHHLVWGYSRQQLARWLKAFRVRAAAGLTDYPALQIVEIKPEDLARLVSYITKMPWKQRQLQLVRNTGKLIPRARRFQPINSVRCARELIDLSLPELTIATGQGKEVLEHALDPELHFEALMAITH